MKKCGLVGLLLLGAFCVHCEPEYSERFLYVAVVGDYGIPFTGAYGDQYDQYDIQSTTPDYFYFPLQESDNRFVGTFQKAEGPKKDLRCLTVRLYLKEYPNPSTLMVQVSQTHPDSEIVVMYRD